MSAITSSVVPLRGPADHTVREQIVEAAGEHFRHYGYEKTTVSDLAKAIGFSKAYIYKFFDSKQAIGEAICAKTVSATIATVEEAVAGATTPTEKFRRMFKVMVATGVTLFFNNRRLYDVAAHAAAEGWAPAHDYAQWIRQLLTQIVREGRETGEFERKTPLDETVHAIYLILLPYANPLLLQHNLDVAEEAPVQLANLVLRSLAP
jgi:AcrR family transcriptional regulator